MAVRNKDCLLSSHAGVGNCQKKKKKKENAEEKN